jgi:hypothetical protein
VRPKICTPTWASPEDVCFSHRRRRGERRLPGALAGPEVGSASEIVTEDLEQIGKKKLKMVRNQGPPNEGPKPEAAPALWAWRGRNGNILALASASCGAAC